MDQSDVADSNAACVHTKNVDSRKVGFFTSLLCGAVAGLAVDVTLYPLDTIKTRLQSVKGLARSGGFRQIYSGIPSVLVGSAPGSALFFCTYESVKISMGTSNELSGQMTGAVFGETVACLVRVPTEVVKQRVQAFPNWRTIFVVGNILEKDGMRGLYRGFSTTIAREIPFSLIQFPLWEYLKKRVASFNGRFEANGFECAASGATAGGVAAALTTPLDLAKTRVMLSDRLYGQRPHSSLSVLSQLIRSDGIRAIFAGILPRSLWMAIGGFVFFGAYESSLILLDKIVIDPTKPEAALSKLAITRDKSTTTGDQNTGISKAKSAQIESNFFKKIQIRREAGLPTMYESPKKPLFCEENLELAKKVEREREDYLKNRQQILAQEQKEYDELRRKQLEQV